MKLISLYIENFGGLHQFALDFEAGITSVIKPNGFGKTTLAEFIRAMFYGFPRKSKTLDRSQRQKYKPWNGGAFGGNLIFEQDGFCYRIERTFGANPKGDTFCVIDLKSGRKTSCFTEEIGQELFGLDAESFERSVYLPQLQESGTFTTASIQAKLTDLMEDSSDVMGFDKAMAALKAERSNLIPYRGGGGTVAETAAAITGLQLRLNTLQAKETQLQKAQEEAAVSRRNVEETKKLLAQAGEQLQAALRQESNRLHRQQYTQLCSQYSKTEAAVRICREKYPAGLPREAELHGAELTAERLKQQEDDLRKKGIVPTIEQLEICRSWCKEYEALQTRLRGMRLQTEEVMGEQLLCPATVTAPASGAAVAAVCGMAGSAAGAVLVFLLRQIYGFAILAAGVLLMAGGILLLCIHSGKKRRYQKELHRQKQAAKDRLAVVQQQEDAVNGMAEKYRGEIAAFFERFDLSSEPRQFGLSLAELERRYARAQAQKTEILAAKEYLQSFFAGLGISCEQDVYKALKQLREDMQTVQTAGVLLQALKEQLAAMEETDGDILFADDPSTQDLQHIRHEERQLRMELTAATTRMLQAEQETLRLREEIAELPTVREELEQARQKLVEDQEKAKILDATIALLQQARENLSTAYMGTIRSRFGFYLAMLDFGDENCLVDSRLQIWLERQGQVRELAYFSAGQMDLLMLCMRLALMDALFRNQEMFIILDDPFVNLDDVHMEQARALLRKLAAERQILYFSCHSGRTV